MVISRIRQNRAPGLRDGDIDDLSFLGFLTLTTRACCLTLPDHQWVPFSISLLPAPRPEDNVLESLKYLPPPQEKLVVNQLGDDFCQSPLLGWSFLFSAAAGISS